MFVSLFVIFLYFFFFFLFICFVTCSVVGCDYVGLRRSREVMCFRTEVVQCLNFFVFCFNIFFCIVCFSYMADVNFCIDYCLRCLMFGRLFAHMRHVSCRLMAFLVPKRQARFFLEGEDV